MREFFQNKLVTFSSDMAEGGPLQCSLKRELEKALDEILQIDRSSNKKIQTTKQSPTHC